MVALDVMNAIAEAPGPGEFGPANVPCERRAAPERIAPHCPYECHNAEGMRHPEMGMVAPARFIPIAEETRRIVAIGDWVLREACRQGLAWHDAGYTGLRVAVNLSPRQFKQANLVQRIEDALAESGFAPAALELEITEGALRGDFVLGYFYSPPLAPAALPAVAANSASLWRWASGVPA